MEYRILGKGTFSVHNSQPQDPCDCNKGSGGDEEGSEAPAEESEAPADESGEEEGHSSDEK